MSKADCRATTPATSRPACHVGRNSENGPSVLTQLAGQLASLLDVEREVDDAESRLPKQSDPTIPGLGRSTRNALRWVSSEAARRREALKSAILDQEPQSLGDMLSLLKVASGELERLTNERELDTETFGEINGILGALHSAVIYLQNTEARSPLRQHDHLVWPQSWPEHVDIARAAARRVATMWPRSKVSLTSAEAIDA